MRSQEQITNTCIITSFYLFIFSCKPNNLYFIHVAIFRYGSVMFHNASVTFSVAFRYASITLRYVRYVMECNGNVMEREGGWSDYPSDSQTALKKFNAATSDRRDN